jgi:spore coat protein U-like protein
MTFASNRHKPTRLRTLGSGVTALALALAVVAPPRAVGTTTAGANATAVLGVSATINSNCTISASAVSFGSYASLQANATVPLNAAGSLSIACTRGSVPRITLDLGQNPSGGRRQMALAATRSPGADRLYYELYQPPNATPGSGCSFPANVAWGPTAAQTFVPSPPANRATRTYSVCGTIPPGQGVSMGSYADTVVATVNF